MNNVYDFPSNWNTVNSVNDAKQLIDCGVVLTYKEAKRLTKMFDGEQRKVVSSHLASRFAETHDTRLQEEVIFETTLSWLVNQSSLDCLQVYLETLLESPERTNACFKLVEIALTTESYQVDSIDELFSMAVSIVCELGLALQDIKVTYPGAIDKIDLIMDHISTYLLSVSNSDNTCVRLSLINYFGVVESNKKFKIGLNKVMGRFGHTVLEHLYSLLFSRKTESVALQYLLENLPKVLEGDQHTQKIVHEIWRFYMLKKTERFALFLTTFAEHIKSNEDICSPHTKQAFFHQLGALLRVAAELNHKVLLDTIVSIYCMYPEDLDRDSILAQLLKLNDLRKSVKAVLDEVLKPRQENIRKSSSALNALQSSAKRGRKPKFSREADGTLTIDQVNFLGTQQVPTVTVQKAS